MIDFDNNGLIWNDSKENIFFGTEQNSEFARDFLSEMNESFRNQLMCRENFSFLPTERTQIIAANDSMGN